MRIEGMIWFPEIIDKLLGKHHVNQEEIEEVLYNCPIFRKIQNGRIPGEHLYSTLGRTESGRYLIVFFIHKITNEVIIVSARDMDDSERKRYDRE